MDLATVSDTEAHVYTKFERPIRTCKICFEADTEDLITPCRWSGSMRYVHEKWLKRWIEQPDREVQDKPTCEICQYVYNIETFSVYQWDFWASLQKLSVNWLMVPLFLVMMALMTLIMVLLIQRLETEENEAAYGIILVTIQLWGVGLFFMLVATIRSLRKSVFKEVILQWKILSIEEDDTEAMTARPDRTRIFPEAWIDENLEENNSRIERFRHHGHSNSISQGNYSSLSSEFSNSLHTPSPSVNKSFA